MLGRVAFLVLLSCGAPLAWGEDLPSLKEIRVELESQLLTLDPIAVEFTVVDHRPKRLATAMPHPDLPQKWTWSLSGGQERYTMQPQFYPATGVNLQFEFAIQGRQLTRVEYSTRQADLVEHVTRTDVMDDLDAHLFPDHLLGRRLKSFDETLLDLLAKPTTAVHEYVEISGDRCVSILAAPIRTSFGAEVTWGFNLSIKHRFLPRRITRRFEGNRPRNPNDPQSELIRFPITIIYDVSRYHEIPDPSGGRPRFFPAEAEESERTFRRTMPVTKVTFGAVGASPAATIPDGVPIDTVANGAFQKRELSGSGSIAKARSTIVKEVPPLPPPGRLWDASPKESLTSRWGAWTVSAVLLFCAFLVWWRTWQEWRPTREAVWRKEAFPMLGRVAFLVLLSFGAPLAWGEDLPSLKEIRAELESQLLTLDPITVRFTVVSERPPRIPKHVPWADQPHRWTWTTSGSRERLVMDECHYEDLGLYVNHDESIDNKMLTRLVFSTRQSKTVTHSTQTNAIVEFGNHLSPAHFLGTRLRSTESTLLGLLSNSGAELVGWSEVDGERCVKVVADPVKTSHGTDVRWEFLLSPSHRFLARRILSRFTVKRPKDPNDSSSERQDYLVEYAYNVKSFRQLSDGGAASRRDFPADCEMVSDGYRTTLVVTDVALQGEPSTEATIPDGAERLLIIDGRPVKPRFSGPDSTQRVREAILRETPPAPPAGRSLDARPRESFAAQWGSWAVSASLLASAVLVWWRSK